LELINYNTTLSLVFCSMPNNNLLFYQRFILTSIYALSKNEVNGKGMLEIYETNCRTWKSW
ncbi:MAG: hypothetical protein RR325_01480, partial [Bacilli bacterium]